MNLKLLEQLLRTAMEIFITFLRSCSQHLVVPGTDGQLVVEQLKVKHISVSELLTDLGGCMTILQGKSACLLAQL